MVAGGDAMGQFAEGDVEVIHEILGANAGDNLGWQVCAVADYNGDGAMEFMYGVAGADPAGISNAGVIELRDGATGALIRSHAGTRVNEGLGYVCDAGDVNNDQIVDYMFGSQDGYVYVYSGADGVLQYEFTGAAGTNFGFRSCGIGDVTGDGFGEMLIGAWSNDEAGNNFGKAIVYSGADGSVVREHFGIRANGQFGHTVSALGDIDGDGVSEYSVGAPGPYSASHRGVFFAYSGATGSELYTFNARTTGRIFAAWQQCHGFQHLNYDGVIDILACDISDVGAGFEAGRLYAIDGATGAELYTIAGFTANSGLSGVPWNEAGSIGDLTGDCISDLVVASWKSQVGGANAGQAHVIDGRTHAVLRTITCNGTNANFAGTLAGAGDANGDGITDYIFAANGYDGARGAVWVVAGQDHTQPSPADLDGNGVLNVDDIDAFVTAFVTFSLDADMDGNFVLNVDDVDAFVVFFTGNCP
ncbi:MAG: hypothetical protein DHS20C14_01770 [Phycisphaeraceae bacterium]|nr:MAG: hypothetical protein DHS20C14_01770 [Phycisphaeraceae bacterium]